MSKKPKLIRLTTVPISMNHIMRGQLKYMSSFFQVLGVSSYVKKDVTDILNREQISMKFVEMARTIHPLKDIVALIKLCILFFTEKPTIVHSHTPKAGLLGMLAAFICRVPIRLHTVAGMPLEETDGLKRIILLFTEKLTYRLAHQVYPNSSHLHQFILENKLALTNKIKLLGKGSSNGINIEYFNKNFCTNPGANRIENRKKFGIQMNDFVFCFVGRLAEAKGINDLCEAFNQLSYEIPHLKLLLIGPIETSNSMLSLATLNLMKENKNIIYPGRAEDIRPMLNLSDSFVFPSYREGFPGVLLQAGAMGIPILASNIGGNNELIKHQENGLLFESKNINSLLNAMKLIYNDVDLREKLSINMNNTILNDYQNKVIWNAIYTEYNSWIGININ